MPSLSPPPIAPVPAPTSPEPPSASTPSPSGGFDQDEDVRIFIGQLDGDGEVTINIRNPSVDVAAVQLSLIDQDGAPLEGVSLLESPLLPDVTLGGAGLLAYSPDGGTIAAGDQQRLLVRLAVDSPGVQSVCAEQVQATTPSLFFGVCERDVRRRRERQRQHRCAR